VFEEFGKARHEFQRIFKEPAKTAGSAGWQANSFSLAAYDEAGLLYAGDARGLPHRRGLPMRELFTGLAGEARGEHRRRERSVHVAPARDRRRQDTDYTKKKRMSRGGKALRGSERRRASFRDLSRGKRLGGGLSHTASGPTFRHPELTQRGSP
jgi:hypothetical protein